MLCAAATVLLVRDGVALTVTHMLNRNLGQYLSSWTFCQAGPPGQECQGAAVLDEFAVEHVCAREHEDRWHSPSPGMMMLACMLARIVRADTNMAAASHEESASTLSASCAGAVCLTGSDSVDGWYCMELPVDSVLGYTRVVEGEAVDTTDQAGSD